MHWTPGWGNLATVLVALVGIGISAWWNKRILREANRRFDVERTERGLERQRSAVVDLLHDYSVWNQAVIDTGYALAHREAHAAANPYWTDFATVTHPFNRSMYAAKLALSDNDALTAGLGRIQHKAREHVVLLVELISVPDGSRMGELRELGEALEVEVEFFTRAATRHLSDAATIAG